MKRAAALLASACLGASFAHAGPAPDLLPGWDASDENNVETIDHSAWQTLLSTYVASHPSGINRVDYAALKGSSEDMARLDAYLDDLQAREPRNYARAEQMAYWINFYNALTVKVVVDAYPVDSIREIHEGWLPFTGPWGDEHATVAGEELTLDNIEHGILRPIWQDGRIHYAVNCASLGCPNLALTVYTADNMEAMLDAVARAYVNHPRGVDFVDEDFMVVSSIYDWWFEDFGGSEEAVLGHLVEYAEGELAERLKDFVGAIDYEYDWALNEP